MRPRKDFDGESELVRAAPFWAAIWIVVLALTLYGATDLQRQVLSSRWLDGNESVIDATNFLVATAERLGLSALHDRLEPHNLRSITQEASASPSQDAGPPHIVLERTRAASSPADEAPAHHAPIRRILLIGASSMQFHLGAELEKKLSASYAGTTVLRYGKLGTGLSRPDTLDWPALAVSLTEEFRPHLVVANFGGNDAQSIVVDRKVLSFRTPEWDREYASRIRSLVEAARARGAEFAFIGMPVMRQASFSRRIEHINAIVEDVAAREHVIYIPTWDLATDEHGGYTPSVTFEGKTGPMRLPDGHHYSRLGAMFVADRVARRLEQAFALVPNEAATTRPRDSGLGP